MTDIPKFMRSVQYLRGKKWKQPKFPSTNK